MSNRSPKVVVIGAGIGGLAAALRLSHAGCDVTVIEAHEEPGGKMRTVPSAAGPVDAGPTVLTMRWVFDALFEDVGLNLNDHVSLNPLKTLARHYWDDGTRLDLMADKVSSIANVRDTFGEGAAIEFEQFCASAERLFNAFEEPMMRNGAPSQVALAKVVAATPGLLRDMSPLRSLASSLGHRFHDPKLAQLFGRYATYVGGSPYASPAILALIWHAEARGVWSVSGGMHALAHAITERAKAFGAKFRFGQPVRRIVQQSGRVAAVEVDGEQIAADQILFNGDPRALVVGLLGKGPRTAVTSAGTEPRSLSAYVGAFAARPSGPDLAHHTVFFGHDPKAEFDALKAGQMPTDATLYLCAQDHANAGANAQQRFEVIMNAPPRPGDEEKEKAQCQTLIFDRFRDFGLTFDPTPQADSMTTPAGFHRLFPASQGSLYGRSPHGLMAAFKRPQARTKVTGLYLCGGGAHPGAGVPMATLSAKHAAEAMLMDQTSTSTSRQTVTPGGMLTASATVESGPSRS